MARRRRTKSVQWLVTTIDDQLESFGSRWRDLSLREKVLELVEIYANVRDLGVNAAAEHGLPSPPGQTRERVRLYLIEYVGQSLAGAEIEVVAGISEYGRRVRELRRQDGYQIATGATPDPDSGISLLPDQYMLVDASPDSEAAGRWHVANRIRRGPGGSKQKLLEFLQKNVGRVVTTEELAYVANDARQYARRTRELRTEQGYQIATRFTGRPDLNVGQYVLQSADRVAPPHDRNISHATQRVVYERDSNTCRVCGWSLDRWTSADPRILEIHHMEEHQHGGSNEAENLVVVCSRCHDEVHSGQHVEILEKVLLLIRERYD